MTEIENIKSKLIALPDGTQGILVVERGSVSEADIKALDVGKNLNIAVLWTYSANGVKFFKTGELNEEETKA